MNIVLASSSERRKEILSIYLKDFIIADSHSKERYNFDFDLYTNQMSISRDKVNKVKGYYENSVIIGADTVVVLEDEILGKPKDINEASIFLQKLSNKEHLVVTSFHISCKEKNIEISDYVKTKVLFNNLSKEEIEDYLSTEEWKGKAGAYAIQEKGAALVKSIDGDYLSVVGLPISKISEYFKKYLKINLMRIENVL